MELTEEACLQLLNFGTSEAPTPLNIQALDLLVKTMHEGTNAAQKKTASDIMTQFKSNELAWTRCHQILEESQYDGTKFFAFQILDDVIKSRWRILPKEQSAGMKQFVVEMVIQKSASFDTLKAQSVLIKKLDMILIQIVKQEWPDKWPTFIPDLVGASKNSESLCENNMVILKLLSEEVFENNLAMTEAKANRLKASMRDQFGGVFELCLFVMKHSECASLLQATLSTLLGFISWIDMNYIFNSQLIPDLVGRFLTVPIFRNKTLECISEISAIGAAETKQKQLEMFSMTMQSLQQILPPSTDIPQAYARGSIEDRNFVNSLALFLSTFLKTHGEFLETGPASNFLALALNYLVNISRVNEIEVFKICLEYWNHIAASLFNETPAPNISNSISAVSAPNQRHAMYSDWLNQVRVIMITRMAKPEEVLVVQKEDEVVREVVKDSDAMEQYKFMRETLVYLTHLDVDSTEKIMTDKLAKQVDSSEYSWNNLSTLCWAIGSISGTMAEENEKRFLVNVIKDLLGLCERKAGKNHKAIIASNIMYIVGQYPRFLRQHWKFLKTVVTKLFEFMHESHEGVQDMACDTFIKIAQKCKAHFVKTQVGDYFPFIDNILLNMHQIIFDLEQHQVQTFYEAIGHMIYAQTKPAMRAELIKQLMDAPNTNWNRIVQEAAKNPDHLCQQNVVDELVNILKMNVRACTSIRNDFIVQLSVIYMNMLHIYKHMSKYIATMIAQHGEAAVKQPIIKSMRLVKRESLKLIGLWIQMSDDAAVVMREIIPPLLEAVLLDFQESIPQARDDQVLATMVKIVKKLQRNISDQVLNIFQAIFESTISMISKDFVEFPDHRVAFYDLLFVITKYCFDAFAHLNETQFEMVIKAIVWGFQHPIRHVAETSLKTMRALLDNVTRQPAFAQTFYGKFYLQIMEHLFQVMTDSLHFGELDLHAEILAHLFTLVEAGKITVPLNPNTPPNNNQQFVVQFIGTKLKEAFPHLKDTQLQILTQGFFSFDQDLPQFKQHLRDFLVESKEVAGEDMSSIYLVERKQKAEQAQQAKMQKFKSITGMLNPHEIEDDTMNADK